MKLDVNIEIPGSKANACIATVTVTPQDLVSAVSEKIAAAQMIGFSEKSLLLDGQPLEPSSTLADAGVTSTSKLVLRVAADERSVVRQLQELVVARALTFDELGLLYCYRNGVSVSHALAMVGAVGSLPELVARHPDLLQVDGKRVRRADAETVREPARAVAPEPKEQPKEQAKEKKKDTAKDKERTAKPKPAQQSAQPAIQRWPQEGFEASIQDLHTTISSRSFHSRASEELRAVQRTVEEKCFLQVEEIVRAGSVGRGTALVGGTDSELVLFVRGLPLVDHERWVPRVTAALAVALHGEARPDGVGVQLGETVVHVSPVFKDYAHLVQTLGHQGPETRPYFQPSFAKEEVLFISKQPGYVKSLMRLLKWWRNQQEWSTPLTTPSDQVLELSAVWTCQQCGKAPLAQGLANCFGYLAQFNSLRVVWGNFYKVEDVWAPLLAQRPLLMDPVNPFRNVADPAEFDARELMQRAQTTTFW